MRNGWSSVRIGSEVGGAYDSIGGRRRRRRRRGRGLVDVFNEWKKKKKMKRDSGCFQ